MDKKIVHEIGENLSIGIHEVVQFSLHTVNICAQSVIQKHNEIYFHKILAEVLVPIVFSLITIIGCAGNGLVIYVIISRRQMRTSLNVLLFNLAVGDLCFLIFCVPLTAYHYASPRWGLGSVFCHIWNYPFFVAFYNNMYTLLLISVWRYLSVVHPSKTAPYRTVRVAVTAAVSLWIIMAVVNIPTIYALKVKRLTTDCDDYVYCGMVNLEQSRIMYLCLSVIGYIIPLVGLVSLNITILHYVKQHVFSKSGSCRSQMDGSAYENANRRTQKISRTIFIVIGSFCASWLPLHFHMVYANYGDMDVLSTYSYRVFRVLAHIMAYANSCANPFIYHCTSTDFRQHFTSVMPRCQPVRPGGKQAVNGIRMREIPAQVRLIQKEPGEDADIPVSNV